MPVRVTLSFLPFRPKVLYGRNSGLIVCFDGAKILRWCFALASYISADPPIFVILALRSKKREFRWREGGGERLAPQFTLEWIQVFLFSFAIQFTLPRKRDPCAVVRLFSLMSYYTLFRRKVHDLDREAAKIGGRRI